MLSRMALMGMEKKAPLLDVLAAEHLLSRTTKLITRLTPYGLFAIAAMRPGRSTSSGSPACRSISGAIPLPLCFCPYGCCRDSSRP